MGGIAWNLAFPVGSVSDFTSKASGLGIELQVNYWILSRLTIGGSIDWQTFVDSRPRTTQQISNGAITATAYNTVQAGALRGGADFYFLEEGMFLPYVGANIGFGWATFQSSFADISLYDNQESFVFGLELGSAFAFAPNAPLLFVGGRYSNMPSSEFLGVVTDTQSITLQLGLLSP